MLGRRVVRLEHNPHRPFPRTFGSNEFDSFALCRRITPTQEDGTWDSWIVAAEYETNSGSPYSPPTNVGQPGAGGGSGAAGDPSLEPQTEEWGTQTREVPLVRDLGDPDATDPAETIPRPILNSAGQPFDPVPTNEDGWTTLTIERNEATVNSGRLAHFRFAVNKDVFLGKPPGRWILRPITARKVYKGAFGYYRFRYEFWLAGENDPDWDDLELLDQGLCMKGPGGVPTPIIRGGQPVSQPVLLKDGIPLTPAQLADPKVGAQFLKYKRRKRRPFAPLNIEL
ncbi:hypothetical protein J0H58_21500 [bacterium]|nr:hypothetical protein [bacterium]